MTNFFETVLDVLKADERFFTDNGEFLRNAVYEAAMKMDSNLIKLLYQNDTTRERFFTDVDGIAVFDKVGFGWVINNRQFLPDSYTRYKNKIGLADSKGNYIATSNDVELVFPYKDCVLEGGQTKEDQKRSEIFYNETLAPDEVDRLLYPKVFTNATRYTADGFENITQFYPEDNLIIKGNNLLAISSLLKRYENKIKFIYLDIPYNTHNDSFGYNDNFNHSSWLTFMKNRLEIAKQLLSSSGTIAIQTDYHENSYLRVLMDSVFFPENYVSEISVQMSTASGPKMAHISNRIPKLKDSILIYSKNKKDFKINEQPYRIKRDWDNEYSKILMNFSKDDRVEFDKSFQCKDYLQAKEIIEKVNLSTIAKEFPEFKDNTEWKKDNAWRIVADKQNTGLDKLLAQSNRFWSGDVSVAKTKTGQFSLFRTDKNFGSDSRVEIIFADNNIYEHAGDLWTDISTSGGFSKEGGISFTEAKKPEKLLKRLIGMFTYENDIVLDFFMGSATTQAVSMKMNRHFIGVEQMEYVENISVERLKQVIQGEQSGISESVNWQGGGSFVYCELAKLNQNFVDAIEAADNDDALISIWKDMQKSGFISYKINPKDIDTESEDFTALSLDDKKKLLMELLDKNQLYVNYCDIDDETFAVSEEDKAFTKSFYGEV